MKFERLCYQRSDALFMRLVQTEQNSKREFAYVVHLVVAQVCSVVLLAYVLNQLFQTSLLSCEEVSYEEWVARVDTIVVEDEIVHQNEDTPVQSN